ncbi:MAG TPA: DUF2298 domain-containing protein [Patescibacteria group bacterium]
MTNTDIFFVLQWWFAFFAIGLIYLPVANLFFNKFLDKGYIFSKIIGIISISYVMFVLGTLHFLPFSLISLIIIIAALAFINIFLLTKSNNITQSITSSWRYFIAEEIIFLLTLFFWSYVRATQPDIHGLEKYMDFGFVNSILRTKFFPATDMWYPPFSINYYYFGHLVTAVLTRLTSIPSSITFNLMLATLFAFTFSCSFSLGLNFLGQFFLLQKLPLTPKKIWKFLHFSKIKFTLFLGALLTAFICTLGGNLHAIYAFFKPYDVSKPLPLWQLPFSPQTFPNSYWYPNATRFIYHTIHEFPLYSFVVSDLHGHVLDIPFVLLTLALLFSIFIESYINRKKISYLTTILVGFMLAVMYMTNAWDGLIYLLLAAFIYLAIYMKQTLGSWSDKILGSPYLTHVVIFFASFFIFALPFNLFFKPFASQIGIMCAPKFLTNIGHLGPFLFETNHCEHSPWWMLLILWGFFAYWVLGLVGFIFLRKGKQKIYPTDVFVLLLSILAILLIIIPEFVYLKDIYTTYYRANTMFKLVYQSFIMLSLSSGYIIIRILLLKNEIKNILLWIYKFVGFWLLIIVALYPYFAVNSYYLDFQKYSGLDGTTYLNKLYPADYQAILWINANIKGQPVMLEAQGDSYTDYERISTNTGLPTILGWTVHEWLWRGSYDPLPQRINDVQTIYTTQDSQTAIALLKKYSVEYVFIGNLEREKYPNIFENKFSQIGKLIFIDGQTRIYQINK